MMDFKKAASLILSVMLVASFSQAAVFADEPDKTDGEAVSQQAVSASGDLFAGGTGTSEDPFQIETVEQLDCIRNDLNAHYVLNNDLSFNAADFSENGQFFNEGKGWDPIGDENGPFAGSLNGQQFTISGLVINSDNKYEGLFGYASGATINNLGVSVDHNVVTTSSDAYIGGIVGYGNNVSLDGCSFTGTLTTKVISTTDTVSHYVGGIAGYIGSGSIINCTSDGNITSDAKSGRFGGIVGYSDCSISRCSNSSNISSNCDNVKGDTYYGGIAGYASVISDSHNSGTINARGIVGGIAGSIAGRTTNTCTNCINEGDITATTSSKTDGEVAAGGIVAEGKTDAETDAGCNNCQNSGTISATSYGQASRAGGISGHGNVFNSVNRGSVVANQTNSPSSGSTFAGGISADAGSKGKVLFSENYGSVTVNTAYLDVYIGGITGFGNKVQQSSNHASVVGRSMNSIFCCVGGIIGGSSSKAGSEVTESYNGGHVEGQFAGGISGNTDSGNNQIISIINCYNFGKVDGSKRAGGIISANGADGYISNVYNIGNVNNLSGPGIAGDNKGTVLNAYYLDNLPTGVGNDNSLGKKLSSAQMKNAASFSGFDFESIWTINGSGKFKYPMLRNVINAESQNNNSAIDDETDPASEPQEQNAKDQADRAAAKQKADAERAMIALNNGIIDPSLPKVKISKPKAAKKSMTAKWKKLSKKQLKAVKGIEVEYSLTSNFQKPIFRKTGKKKTNVKIKKLVSKKTYYVRVHTYVIRNGVKYVSNWSGAKKVKIK